MNKNRPHYLQHRKRLKERFQKSPSSAEDYEIIELLLGYVIKRRDTKPQAKDIVVRSNNIADIFNVDISDIKGVGSETLFFLKLIDEYLHRFEYRGETKKYIILNRTESAFNFLRYIIGNHKELVCATVYLDAKNKLINYKLIEPGLLSSQYLIRSAIDCNAVSVIIAYNSHKKDLRPSKDQLELAHQITESLRYTGINVLDCLLMTFDEYYSMNAMGDIEKMKKKHSL